MPPNNWDSLTYRSACWRPRFVDHARSRCPWATRPAQACPRGRLPLSILAVGLTTNYSPWLSRFLLVPLALTAPLLAAVLRRRDAGIAIVAVAAITSLAHTRNLLKPLRSGHAVPWRLTQADAVDLPWLAGVEAGHRAVDPRPRLEVPRRPARADDPAFLLYGDRLQRHVTFLTVPGAMGSAAGNARA